jgi:hypothetical protein
MHLSLPPIAVHLTAEEVKQARATGITYHEAARRKLYGEEHTMGNIADVVERYERARATWSSVRTSRTEAEALVLLADAIAYIKFLQPLAGAVTPGESFDDIAKRVGRQEKPE